MSLREILDQSLAMAQAAEPLAKVYKHLVWSTDDADIAALFKDTQNRINTIMITRESTPSADAGTNENYDQHSILMKWYRSANRAVDASTASEDTFQDDVEAMRAAFKANRKLTDGNGTRHAVFCTPMTARLVSFVMFKSVLCNYAELVFVAKDGPFATTSV